VYGPDNRLLFNENSFTGAGGSGRSSGMAGAGENQKTRTAKMPVANDKMPATTARTCFLLMTFLLLSCEYILPKNDPVDAILHDPPRFGIAGELYSQVFYDHLAKVLKRKGRLFHYTGTPNKLTSGRDVPNEVAKRLRRAGFVAELNGDGVLAVKR